jgi:hypothetical protein
MAPRQQQTEQAGSALGGAEIGHRLLGGDLAAATVASTPARCSRYRRCIAASWSA